MSIADLAGETWISTRRDTAMATNLDRLCAASGFEQRVSCRSNEYDVIRALVAGGLGIALVPGVAVPTEADVAVVRLADEGAVHRVWVRRSPVAPKAVVDEAVVALRSAAEGVCGAAEGVELVG